MDIRLILFGFCGVAIIIYAISLLFDHIRTTKLKHLAPLLGMTFTWDDPEQNLDKELKHLMMPSINYKRIVYNVLCETSVDAPIHVADYIIEASPIRGGATNSFYLFSKSIHRTIFYINTKDLDLPYFTMKPKSLLYKLGLKGKRAIDFSQSHVFSKNYVVKGINEEAIYQLFNRQIRDYFTQHSGVYINAEGQRLVISVSIKRVSVKKLPDFIRQGKEIAQLFLKK